MIDLPLYGKLKLVETSKTELLNLWIDVLEKNNIKINEHEKVLNITRSEGIFHIETSKDTYHLRMFFYR